MVVVDPACQTELARKIQQRSIEHWGPQRPTVLIGRHQALSKALERVARVAPSESPALISGETGTGKELFARALYLLSRRSRGPFLAVNCAQYQDGQLMAGELFGHKRGSFTGAVADHRGIFEEAAGGVVFLDEVGELTPQAQSMLLRALSEGEVVPVGGTHAVRVDARVVAATSRDLKALVDSGAFRADLYYRLRYFHIRVPALRERGRDWELILDNCLRQLGAEYESRKRLSADSVAVLDGYTWPGNVREARAIADTGFHLCNGLLIEPRDFADALEAASRTVQLRRVPIAGDAADLFARLCDGEVTFWDAVHRPYMDRELSRAEVRQLISQGLSATQGSYKKLLGLFGIPEREYLRFMDFLRHQRLKPTAPSAAAPTLKEMLRLVAGG
jgi:DNA-binding NtrC family response regulator